MTAPALARLLLDHPFGDDEGLLYTAERSMTRGEAVAAARTTADGLRALGVREGQGVAIRLPNGPEFVTSMMGVWLAGAVLVPVNPRVSERELGSILERTAPAALVGPDGTAALDGRRSPDPRTYAPETAFVLWTSGTTGTPKPILHTHTAYLELLDRVLGPLRGSRGGGGGEPRRPPTPNLIPVSLALNAGLYNALFGLRAGAALVIMDGFSTTEFERLVGSLRDPLHGPPAGGDRLAQRRSRRREPGAAQVRAQHHRPPLPPPGATLPRQVLGVRPERLRAGGGR